MTSRFEQPPAVGRVPASDDQADDAKFHAAPWNASDPDRFASAAEANEAANKDFQVKKGLRQVAAFNNEDIGVAPDPARQARGSVPFPVCATEPEGCKIPATISEIHASLRSSGAFLTVMTDKRRPNTGNPVIWGLQNRQHLTWAIDPRAGKGLEVYAVKFRKAFSDWEAACGVNFIEVNAADAAGAVIKLRWANAAEEEAGHSPDGGSVIAAAFFPGEQPEDRYVKIYQAFKTYPFQTSVLRHEFGHILGFRHEHIWAPDADPQEDGEDTTFSKQLTEYDPDSIMNYRKMHGDARLNRPTPLSAKDKIGSRLVYGAPFHGVNFI